MKAIADYHRLTCLRFVPYNGQKDYISIQSGNTGCWSSVGRIGKILISYEVLVSN